MTKDHLDHYREFGYAVVRGVFDAGEIAEMAAAFDRLYAEGLSRGASFRHHNVFFQLARDARLGLVVRMVQWPSYVDSVLDRYRLDPRLLKILAPLVGTDLKQIINQLHWKPPGAAMTEFGYHQDARFRRPRAAYRDLAASYVQIGIAIDPHRPENGAMTVYPGSHRLGLLPSPAKGRVRHNALREADLLALGLDPAGLVHLELDPGDVALWHVYTVHGSGPNVSGRERRFYINGYVKAANCDRGVWAFRGGEPCPLGAPVLIHYEDLYARPGPYEIDPE